MQTRPQKTNLIKSESCQKRCLETEPMKKIKQLYTIRKITSQNLIASARGNEATLAYALRISVVAKKERSLEEWLMSQLYIILR